MPLWRALPGLYGALRKREEAHREIREINLLRNRIAHHEPIHTRDYIADHDRIIKVIGWISADTRMWVEDASRVLATTMDKPTPLRR